MKIPKSFLLLSGAAVGLTLLSGERDGTGTPSKAQIVLREKMAELKGEPAPLPRKEDLLADLQRLHREGKISDQQFETFKKNIQEQYAGPAGSANPENQALAQQALQQKLTQLNKGEPVSPPSSTEAQAKAQKILDEQRVTAKKAEATPPPAETVARQSVQPKPTEPIKQQKTTSPPSNTEAQAKAQKTLDEQRATAIARQPKPVEPAKQQKAVVTAPSTSTATQVKAPKAVAEKPAPVKKAAATPPPATAIAKQPAQPKPVEPATEQKATTRLTSTEAQAKAQSVLEELRAKELPAVVTAPPTSTKTQAKAQKAPPEQRAQVKKAERTPRASKTVSQPALAQNAAELRTEEKTNVIPKAASTALTPELEAQPRESSRSKIAKWKSISTPDTASTPAQARALAVLRENEAVFKAGATPNMSKPVQVLRVKLAELDGTLPPGEAERLASGTANTSTPAIQLAAPTTGSFPAVAAFTPQADVLAPVPFQTSNKVGLARLQELTELYRADRISPYDYHHERAKIVASL
jgi:hypothetical protein